MSATIKTVTIAKVRIVTMCVKCKHRVFFDPVSKVLYYMDEGCNKVPLPTDAQLGGGVPIGGGSTPTLPPVNPDLPVTQDLACYKANGVWDVLNQFAEAMFNITWVGNLFLYSYAEFGRAYPHLKANNLSHLNFWRQHADDDKSDMQDDWNLYKDEIKAAMICFLSNIFEKSQYLTTPDLAALKTDWAFETESEALNDWLLDLLFVPENTMYQEYAAYYADNQMGECDCAGSEPTPPVPPIAAGCVRVQPGLIVHPAFSDIGTFTPTTIKPDPFGVKVGETTYQGQVGVSDEILDGADPDRPAAAFAVMWRLESGMRVKGIRGQLTYAPVAGSTNAYHAVLAIATGETTAFESLKLQFIADGGMDFGAGNTAFDHQATDDNYHDALYVYLAVYYERAESGSVSVQLDNLTLLVENDDMTVEYAVPTLVYC
jgi:hypothetical protein